MNYNNYGQFGYNGYPYQNQQQQYQQTLNNYNNYQTMQNQQRAKCDYLAISNIEEVKSFLMQPNTTVFFKDVNNKVIYEKKSDSQGISEIRAFKEINLESKSNNNEYITAHQFNTFKNEIEQKINDCIQKTQNMNPIEGNNNE